MIGSQLNRKLRYYRRKFRKISSAYWLRWLKASLLLVIAPMMILSIYFIQGKLDLLWTLGGMAAIFVFSMIFIRPYLSDLSALTNYVDLLAQDKNAKAPSLSFLSNVEKLSSSVNELHAKWRERRLHLEETIIESKIVFDILPDIVIMLDDHMNILRTNSTANVVFRKRIIGLSLESVLPDSSLHKLIRWVMHERKSEHMELYLPEPMNHYYIAHVEKFPVYSPAGISIILVLHDITESKHTEKLFADFVANASHEIRTPLTSLLGFIETLRTTAKNDPDAQERFLKIMGDQGERMSHLVNDLLSLSKIEMKAHTLPTELVDIRSIIEIAISQLEWMASDRHISLQLCLDVEENRTAVIGDNGELIQLFSNLIGNAIKYGNINSMVTITIKRVMELPKNVVVLRGAKQALAIEVKDEGEGIDKEHLPHLTERFYRVDSARSRSDKIGGTGLGLSIVKHIIKRHQGGLTIESTVGVGSKFTVYFATDTLGME